MGIFDPQGLPSSPQTQNTQTGQTTGSLAPWAAPYVNNYLNMAQNLTSQGVQPSALQNQSYIGAANLTMPGAFGAAEGLATQAGQGQLASAPIAYGYGTQGSQYGTQGANLGITGGGLYGGMGANYGMAAGQNYANMATDPSQMQAYMNPYVQQSLKPQLDLLNQQQQLGAQGIAAKAVGQGAFGGNRATLAQGLNAQNYDLARQTAIAQGYDTAFKNAQQAQQFGSTLGLQGALGGAGLGLQGVGTQLSGTGQGMQGAQVGLQGVSGAQQGYSGATNAANALTNLGTAQTNAQMGILGLQNQFGTQQYNMPYQQAQFLQGMSQGLPISTQNTSGFQQGYQAAPNKLSQISGLGTAALGTLGLLGGSGINNIGSGIKAIGSGIGKGYDYLTGGGNNDVTGPAGGAALEYDPTYVATNEWDSAKGGQVKEKRYASGGLITLAIENAMRG